MRDKSLRALEKNLPNLFRRNEVERFPDDDYVIIPIDPLSEAPIEVEQQVAEEAGDHTISSRSLTRELERSLEDELDPETRALVTERERDTDGIVRDLAGRLGDGFAGAPYTRRGRMAPPPDALAFYLPFHLFSRNVWGIYLLLEGVNELATDLQRIARGGFSRQECVRLARAYLYHHEAYHNAIEGFATRLEIALRRRVYLAACLTLYHLGVLGTFHEEAIATAYGIWKAAMYLPVPRRKLARLALSHYMSLCPVPYSDALRIRHFSDEECEYLESAQNLSLPKSKSMPSEIWLAAGYKTAPTLRRNSRCSYIISRKSALSERMRLAELLFDRRKVLKRLREEVGGELQSGGKHQKWVEADGIRKAPIPSGSDIAIGTLGEILKQLGIAKTPHEFMHG